MLNLKCRTATRHILLRRGGRASDGAVARRTSAARGARRERCSVEQVAARRHNSGARQAQCSGAMRGVRAGAARVGGDGERRQEREEELGFRVDLRALVICTNFK